MIDFRQPALSPKKRGFRFFLRENWYLLLCMAIPVFLVYLIYLAREIHPFGDGCVLVLDLNGQYVWFFEALRNFVYGDGSLLYSFERALGGEFLGIYAYYIASPFSYLVCLFPKTKMLEALLTLFLLKTAICGGTFGYYMKKTAVRKNPVSIVIFSVCYAVSSYAIVQQHNTMWIDAMMWLPLITLGIEELIRCGKFKLYTFLLAVTLFSNFYIGFMVCFWCAFYFILFYLAHGGKNGENNPFGERLHFLKSLLRMAFFSLLAIGMAAVILLGAYYSLNFGKTTFSTTKWEWYLNFDFLELFYKFLPGSYDTVRPEGFPFVYCGVLTLLLLPAYFVSKKYTMRRKICSAALILIFLASFSFSVPDLFWHGFQAPNWLNYRYSFMLCFYLCVLACRALEDPEALPLKLTLGMGGLIAIFTVFLQKFGDDAYFDPNDFTCIWFTLACLLVHLSILGFLRSKLQGKQVVGVALLVAVCIEVFVNGLFNMNALDDDVTYSRYSYYNNFLKNTRPLVNAVQASDSSFYRMEKTYFRKVNDNMGLEMRGLSGSTSTLNQETVLFLEKMGYSSRSHWSKYGGGTPVNDSLLGLKYILSDSEIYQNYYEIYLTDPAHQYIAYRNPYALSIAYGVDDALLDFPLGYSDSDGETKKGDDEPSKIGTAIEAVKQAINRRLDIDETIRRGNYIDEYNSPFERLNAIVTAMLGEEETVKIFVPIKINEQTAFNLGSPWYADKHVCYDVSDSSTDAKLTATIEMPVSGELYFYQPTRYPREVSLNLSNRTTGKSTSCGTFAGNDTMRIVSLGNQTQGDTLSLTMTLESSNLYYVKDADWFYYIDWDVFENAMARLASDQFEIGKYSERSFSGTITTSRADELILSTIAFDKGWKVTVDGNPVETVKALGSLVAFRVPGEAGTHTVKMIYRPNTFVIGSVVSIVSVLLFALLVLLSPLLRKVPVLRCAVSVPNRGKKDVPTEITVKETPLPPPDDPPAERPSDEAKKESPLPYIVGGIAAIGSFAVAAFAFLRGQKKNKKE